MADPYWVRFCTPLARNILALIQGHGGESGTDEGPFILEEHIDAVLGDGRYRIGGDVLAAKGKAILRVGQRVHVLWRRNKRERILTHQWKREQGQTWAEFGGPIVEELWIGGGDVWFRNATVAASLDLARFSLPGSLGQVGWGAREDRFFVQTVAAVFVPGTGLVFNQYISVFKFAREPGQPLPAGTDPASAVTLERTHALATDTYVVAHYAPGGAAYSGDLRVSHVGHGSLAFGGSNISIGVDAIALSDEGHIIVAFSIQGTLLATSAVIPGSSPPSTTTTTWELAHPVVVDLDTHTKLLDAFADGAAAWGPEAGIIPNVYPVYGFPVVLEGVAPSGAAIHHPEEDQRQRFTLTYPLVVGGQLIAFVGTSQRRRNRTGFSVAEGYPVAYIVDHRTLVAQPPPQVPGGTPPALLVLVSGGERYPNDLRFDANETHILWHRVAGEGEAVHWHAFLTAYGLGTTADAGESQARFFDRNVRLIAPSFAWQPGAPASMPTDDKNRFLLLWDFDSGAPIVSASGSDVTEDDALKDAKAMADLPTGAPTQPSARGALEVHVINAPEALTGVGRYRDYSAP